jgi:hypothetical protein
LLVREELEQGTVTAIGWLALSAIAEMSVHGLRLFRPEFLVQIFPKPNQYFLTFHTPDPLATSLPVPVGNRTAGPVTWFHQAVTGPRISEAA